MRFPHFNFPFFRDRLPKPEENTTLDVPKPPRQDSSFEDTTQTKYINHLLGLDTNADGMISSSELQRGRKSLLEFSEKPFAHPQAKELTSLLLAFVQENPSGGVHYKEKDGILELSFPLGGIHHKKTLSLKSDSPVGAHLVEINGSKGVVDIQTSQDPGDFYCEHMFFSAQLEASNPNSSVLQNSFGEPLVGFLHIPADAETYLAESDSTTPATERHENNRKTVGAALKGYTAEAFRQVPSNEAVRVILSGYETFSNIQNNPTGHFVRDKETVEQMLQEALGADSQTMKWISENPPCLQCFAVDPKNGKHRELLLTLPSFEVADSAISPNSTTSIQSIMAKVQPHVVLSMGVHSGSHFRVEYHADSGNLHRTETDASHRSRSPATVSLVDNFSLARAIQQGLD